MVSFFFININSAHPQTTIAQFKNMELVLVFSFVFLNVGFGSATIENRVINADTAFSISCDSSTTPVWMKDDKVKVAQSLAIGDRRVARFTDHR